MTASDRIWNTTCRIRAVGFRVDRLLGTKTYPAAQSRVSSRMPGEQSFEFRQTGHSHVGTHVRITVSRLHHDGAIVQYE